MDAHEPSLSSRHLKLSLNNVIKLNSCPTNPTYSCVFELQNAKLFEKSQFVTPPLGLWMLPRLESSGLDLDVIDDTSVLDTALSTLSVPIIHFDLTRFLKKQQKNLELIISVPKMS